MATAQVFSSAGDGLVRNNGAASWATLRAAATGTVASYAGTTTQVYADGTAGDQYIDRLFIPFDLSSLSGATVTAAVLSVFGTSSNSGAGGAIGLVSGSPASITALATTDFGSVGSTEYMTRVNFSAASWPAYNNWTLNASGITYLQGRVGSTAALVLRSSFDIDNSAPGTGTFSSFAINASEATGTANDPYLTITYTMPVGGPPLRRRPSGLYTVR